MNNKVIIAVVVIIILLAGGFFLFSKNYSQNTQTSLTPTNTQATSTVTYTASGFSPASLTVKAGTTVTWVNKSGSDATVNSAPHPIHTAYPPLNLGGFSDGSTLSLTFDKPGTYGYHNHLNPSDTGEINVL